MNQQIYTYGIIDSNDRVNEASNGLEGAAIYNIPYRDIGLVASDFPPSSKIFGRSVNLDRVLKHLEVVERLMDKFTVLPVRYLTVFNGKEDALFTMGDNYDDFRGNLNRLQNKVEFGVKVIWPGDAISKQIASAYGEDVHNMSMLAGSPVKTFLKEKFVKYKIEVDLEEQANSCIAVVDDFLSGFAVEKKLEKLKSKNLLLNSAYLVKREEQDNFKQAFRQLRTTQSSFKYLFSGPWPPYNFINMSCKSGRHNFGLTDI